MNLSLSQLEELTNENAQNGNEQNQVKNKRINLKKKEDLQAYTNTKIKNIYKFLENVEQTQTQSTPSRNIDAIEKEHEYITKLQQLQGTTQTQKIEIEEQQLTIENLKQILDRSTQKLKDAEINYKESLQRKLLEQKGELESVINRHLSFIDQLINDKKELNTQVEQLTFELKGIDKNGRKQIDELKQQFARELKQKQEQWGVQEKQRRDKWEKERIVEIKEQTIKGLEPEIERMVDKNRKEAKRIEEKYTKEMEIYRNQLAEEFEQKFRNFKEKMLLENEQLLQKEREAMTLRNKDMYLKFEREFEMERDRLKKRCHQDIVECEQRRKDEADGYVKRLRMLQDEQADEIRRVKEDSNKQVEEMKEQYYCVEKSVKDQLKLEQDGWMQQYMVKAELEMNRKISDIQKKLESDRNQQIEVIVQKLISEQQQAEQTLQIKYDKKLRDAMSQSEDEVKRLKRELKAAQDRGNKEGSEFQTISKANQEQQQTIQQIQSQNQELQKDIQRLKEEAMGAREKLTVFKDEQDIQLKGLQQSQEREKQKLQEQHKKLQEEMQKQKHTYETYISELDDKHAQDLEQVEENVKRILNKKDSESRQLREELKIKQLSCEKYEEMLKKQRIDLLKQMEP